MSKKEKTKLEETINKLEKQFGKNIVSTLKDKPLTDIDVISTGCISLDQALGIKGIPKGRVTEIFGWESSGKSSLVLNCTRECQKQGGRVAYIDSEFAFDPSYAKLIGVNTDELLFSQPDTAEDALEIVDELIESGEVDLIIVDSVASMVCRAEKDGEMGQSHMGVMARLMGQALRKIAGSAKKNNVAVIFINQFRKNINISFGSPNTTPAGNALKFASSIRMEMARIKTIKKGDEALATEIKVKVVKNKLAAPYKEAKFEIWFDSGICRISDVIKIALEQGIIFKKGSWFSYNEENIAQGQEALRNKLKEDKELFNKIKKEIYLEK